MKNRLYLESGLPYMEYYLQRKQEEGNAMKIYEFVARPVNGMIPLPNDLLGVIQEQVRVVNHEVHPASLDESTRSSKRISELLLPPSLDTRGWRFNRDEANDRAHLS